MTTPEKVRESFEAWFRKTLLGAAEKRGEDLELYNLDADQRLERARFKDIYGNPETQELWDAWQAAIDSQSSIIDGLRQLLLEIRPLIDSVSGNYVINSNAETEMAERIYPKIYAATATLPTPGESNNG